LATTGWKRISAVLGAVAGIAAAGPPTIPLRDLRPAYVRPDGRVLRSRHAGKPGLPAGGVRHRGLNVPGSCRMGFDLDGCFDALRVKVAALEGSKGPVRFLVHGRGRVLAATPPLFPGAKALELDVPLDGALLLELETRGEGRGGWIEGQLLGRENAKLGRFRVVDAPFDPRDYPVSFRRRVNEGIAAAARYLRAAQDGNGSWRHARHGPGVSALATLALLKAGAKPDDPAIDRAFARLRAWNPDHTYTCSVLLMAIEARYFPGGHEDRAAAVDRPKRAREVIPDEDRAWVRRLARWLVDQQGAGFPQGRGTMYPVWRYPRGGYDLSNTQYALFGLTAARRCGADTREAWLPALRFLLGAQEAEGPEVVVSRYFRHGRYMRRKVERAQARGFGYRLESRPTGAMTSAGLCSLVLCQQALERNGIFVHNFKRRTRDGVRDALAWLEEYYDLEDNPFQPGAWWAYYLFNVERAGVLLDQRYIGTRDWYEEGSELPVNKQRRGGAVGGGVVDTAFALLFWKRATVPARTSPLK